MIRAAIVNGALTVDPRLFPIAVAAPMDLVVLSTDDPEWAAAIGDHDIVLVVHQADPYDRIAVVTMLRARTTAAIVLAGVALDEVERAALLDAGADDVLVTPLDVIELGARIRGILRRTMPDIEIAPVEWVGSHLLSLGERRAWNVRKARRVQLSPIQWQVLAALVRRPGETVPMSALRTEIWGESSDGRESYVRQYIVQLRRKLELNPQRPRHLLTDHGRGYRYER